MPFYNPADPAFVPSVDQTSVGFGIGTLASISTGIHNTALGNQTLNACTTGNRDISIGGLSGTLTTTGSDNTFVGHGSGRAVTTGSQNTVIGSTSASSLTTGSNNIIIGYNVDAAAADANTINIGGAIKVANVGTTNDVSFPGSFIASNIARASASLTANANATYANVVGLVQTVVPGTYKFRAVLPSTVASGTGGIKYCFAYTTAVLSSIEATGIGYTASAVAVQHTTTTTTGTDLFTQAAIVIMTILEGTCVVSTGGTVQVQMAQNTSNASNTIALLGGTLQFDRIA